ncbi:MAG: presenilin family intramembrane aspartyl protease, partial [Candidatus Woesearchaeota archaeon]
MKHSLKITTILLLFFIFAQYIGLGIVYGSIDFTQSTEGNTVFKELAIGERPPVEENTSYLPIIAAIIVGTLFLLLLIKLNWVWVWKIWFLIAVVLALTMAFGVYIIPGIAFGIALVLGIWKIFKPNFWVHNLTELFIYGGLAVIFVPIFNIFSVSVLLVLIAIYDAYAVWKSKHMITLAKSQTKANIFAGLFIPYTLKKKNKHKGTKTVTTKSTSHKGIPKVKGVKTAILGGGDIGFPL